MHIRIFVFHWKGEPLFNLFIRRFQRRALRNRRVLRPVIEPTQTHFDLTAYEVGQLMGGN